MAALIKLKSGEFLDKFIKEFDYKNYRFLLVSEDITTEDHKNVYPLKTLIPPPNAISDFVANGYTESYVKKYVKHLQTSKNALLIATIVNMVVTEDRNVVLMCSDHENEYKYLKILCDYIMETYGVEVFSYKKYSNNPEKCEKLKGKKKLSKVLEKHIDKLSEAVEKEKTSKMSDSKFKKKLKEYSKSQLKQMCKAYSIDIKKDDSKKDLIKRIIKTVK